MKKIIFEFMAQSFAISLLFLIALFVIGGDGFKTAALIASILTSVLAIAGALCSEKENTALRQQQGSYKENQATQHPQCGGCNHSV